jgi:hypothetical protein
MLFVSISFEKLERAYPEMVHGDPLVFHLWLENTHAALVQAFQNLGPGDAFIHPDWINVEHHSPAYGRCESCGAPATELGQFKCDYCDSLLVKIQIGDEGKQ